MQPQMILDSRELSDDSLLRVYLFSRFHSQFATYKLLAEWLDVYTYILPTQRVLHPIAQTIPTSRAAYLCWQYQSHAETCLTLEEQIQSWKLIQSKSIREF